MMNDNEEAALANQAAMDPWWGAGEGGDKLAPSAALEDDERDAQSLANRRSRANAARYRSLGLHLRIPADPGPFWRKLAARPERIGEGDFMYGLPTRIPFRDLLDHPRFYYRGRQPFAAIFHPYPRLTGKLLKALADWTTDVGINVSVDADSEYYPGVTLRVVFWRHDALASDFPGANLA